MGVGEIKARPITDVAVPTWTDVAERKREDQPWTARRDIEFGSFVSDSNVWNDTFRVVDNIRKGTPLVRLPGVLRAYEASRQIGLSTNTMHGSRIILCDLHDGQVLRLDEDDKTVMVSGFIERDSEYRIRDGKLYKADVAPSSVLTWDDCVARDGPGKSFTARRALAGGSLVGGGPLYVPFDIPAGVSIVRTASQLLAYDAGDVLLSCEVIDRESVALRDLHIGQRLTLRCRRDGPFVKVAWFIERGQRVECDGTKVVQAKA